jgi:iron complex outermembrane receptor protein
MNYSTNQPGRVDFYRRALLVGLGAQLFTVPALNAADATAPTEMKKTVITGSLIPTADTVGVAPVETMSSADIQKIGGTDILMSLKALSTSFSGSGNVGQSLNNGGYGEAYLAIRNLPTLTLIDGKRVNISAFSTFAGTYAVDVNTIPVAMIERIEVLKDGASTLYGSDAIGGVVNIITKKDFNGVEVSGRYGFGLNRGVYNEVRGSAVMGYAKDKTTLTVGANYYGADPLYTKNRSIGGLSLNDLAAAGLNAPSYFSGSYPGRAGSFILAGSPLAVGAPGYNAKVTTPPILTGGPYATVAAYNAAALAQKGFEPYISIKSTPASQSIGGAATLLNTTTLNTVSFQRQDRRNLVANLEQVLFEDHATFYAQLLYSKTESLAQLAPAPIASLGGSQLTIPASNPFNPFGIDTGAGAANLGLRSRLIETGNRSFSSDSDALHAVAGLKGDVSEKYHYDVSVDYSRTQQVQSQNSASAPFLNLAMTPLAPGSALSQLKDANGVNVPLYNIFGLPGSNNAQTINAIKASGFQSGFSDLIAIDGAVRGEIFDLPAGAFQLALGGQYIGESLNTGSDPLLASGNLVGLNALPVFPGGNRDRVAGFAEASIPVISPQQNIPGIYKLDISTSGRIENVKSKDNSKSAAVPKVGVRWQPFDEQLTVAGTYSQGFVVPALTQLYGPALESNPYIVVPDDGNAFKPAAVQGTVEYLSNAKLPPSNSETYTASLTYSPKQIKNLTLGFSYYRIEQANVAFYPTATSIIADLNKNGAASTWIGRPELYGNPIYLDQNNNPYTPTAGVQSTFINVNNLGTVNLPLLPGGALRTDGFDASADYLFDVGAAGTVRLFTSANILMSYEVKLPGGSQYNSYKGQYTDGQAVAAAQGMIPDYNISAGFTWSYKALDYTVIAHYLPGVTDLGDTHPSVGAPVNDFTAAGGVWKVPSYYKIDMQLAYTFKSPEKKWYDGTRLAVGLNNVTDERPNLIASSSEDNTDKSTYDIIGRFLYVEVSKKF